MTSPRGGLSTWLRRLRSRSLQAGTLQHDGLTRLYLLYVPQHFAHDGRKLPLVVMLHGGAGFPAAMAQSSAMHQIAEREGFIVAYPAGTQGRVGLTWNPGGQGLPSDVDDVGFIRDLISQLRQRHAIDADRVYVAGMSIGGALAYRLACSLSESLAAIAVVAGVMTYQDCDPTHTVSVIHIHGTADQRVTLRGGRGRLTARHNSWPPVRSGIDAWREINNCRSEEVIRLVDGLIGYRYTGDGDVELWLVEGGRHVWPGPPAATGWRWWWLPYPRPAEFSASEKAWNFFAAHPRSPG